MLPRGHIYTIHIGDIKHIIYTYTAIGLIYRATRERVQSMLTFPLSLSCLSTDAASETHVFLRRIETSKCGLYFPRACIYIIPYKFSLSIKIVSYTAERRKNVHFDTLARNVLFLNCVHSNLIYNFFLFSIMNHVVKVILIKKLLDGMSYT